MEEIKKYVDYAKDREYIRILAKSMYSFQDLRIRNAGRLQKKKDGEAMKDNGTTRNLSQDAEEALDRLWEKTLETENHFKRALEAKVKEMPEWKYFLKDVKGCGPLMAAVLISEIDIVEAVYPSKIHQYAGLNPGMVFGKKIEGDKIVQTQDLVKGDRPTAGYVLPYNKFLKTKVLKVLADSFIMSKSPYTEIYYNEKHRLKNSANAIQTSKGDKKWCETSDAHIAAAAKRKMMHVFLIDYWKAVRQMYGLPVRGSYAEEYLGRVHNDPKWRGEEA